MKSLPAKTSLKDFMRPWARLCAAYPRYDMGSTTATIYHERLQKYDVELLIAAVDAAIDRSKFFPAVAEIIDNVTALGGERQLLLSEPRPTKEEAHAVLESLHESIRRFESADLKSTEARIAARKAELAAQAKLLGVKK